METPRPHSGVSRPWTESAATQPALPAAVHIPPSQPAQQNPLPKTRGAKPSPRDEVFRLSGSSIVGDASLADYSPYILQLLKVTLRHEREGSRQWTQSGEVGPTGLSLATEHASGRRPNSRPATATVENGKFRIAVRTAQLGPLQDGKARLVGVAEGVAARNERATRLPRGGGSWRRAAKPRIAAYGVLPLEGSPWG